MHDLVPGLESILFFSTFTIFYTLHLIDWCIHLLHLFTCRTPSISYLFNNSRVNFCFLSCDHMHLLYHLQGTVSRFKKLFFFKISTEKDFNACVFHGSRAATDFMIVSSGYLWLLLPGIWWEERTEHTAEKKTRQSDRESSPQLTSDLHKHLCRVNHGEKSIGISWATHWFCII